MYQPEERNKNKISSNIGKKIALLLYFVNHGKIYLYYPKLFSIIKGNWALSHFLGSNMEGERGGGEQRTIVPN